MGGWAVGRVAAVTRAPPNQPSCLRQMPMRVPACPPAANLLKPALARGDLHCIGATTVEEFRKHIEADGAFARRFQVGEVDDGRPVP